MTTTNVFGARPFRLALAFAFAIAVVTAAAFGLIYLQVSRTDTDRVSAILIDEARLNVDADAERLRAALATRQMPDIRRVDYIGWFDAKGGLVLGNLTRLPSIAADGAAHFVDAQNVPAANAQPETVLFVARRRADGGILALGRGLSDTFDLENTLLRALTIALAPTVALILGIGAFFARRAGQRLHRLHGAIAQIMEGDLNSRLPISKEDDEIDRVARGVNLMLDEIVRLLDQLKSVGDNIAHDLRTPLAVARMKLERALNLLSEPDAAADLMIAALAQLDKAGVTIAALLRISAVENGPREKRFHQMDLAAICEQVFDLYEPLAEAKSIRLTVGCPNAVWIRGDEDLIREAISNLVNNAIKFTPAGGAVYINASSADGRPFAQISDNGPGVPESERDKIFRRFYRGDDDKFDESYGIGLNIAQTIAKLHGFELIVEDNKPGARFTMRATDRAELSLVRAQHDAASPLASPGRPPLQNLI